jgi:hypothetical protein
MQSLVSLKSSLELRYTSRYTHDPVSALVRQHMTALRQTFGDEHVLFAPIWRCGLRGDYNYGLSAQIVQLRDAPCGSRKILKLARNGVTEFLLNPKG